MCRGAIARAKEAGVPIIVDPVMRAKGGALAVGRSTKRVFEMILPLATLLTPNVPEAGPKRSGNRKRR